MKSSPFGRNKKLPHIGVVLTGDPSPAAGTENVILGVFHRSKGTYGFFDGIAGLLRKEYIEVEERHFSLLNSGGERLLGYKKLRKLTDRDVKKIQMVCEELELEGLVIIGGIVELTEVAKLAKKLQNISIIGVIQSPNFNYHMEKFIPVTLGFDSCRGVLFQLLQTRSFSKRNREERRDFKTELPNLLPLYTFCKRNREEREDLKTELPNPVRKETRGTGIVFHTFG